MIDRNVLVQTLDEYLACSMFTDYAPNGLQLEGNSTIKTVATAVTASEQVIEHAIDIGAEALIVHHGFFWRGESPVITGMKRCRIAKLCANNINLLAYHLPLDAHLELGNNACIGRLLNATEIYQLPVANNPNLLWGGMLPASYSVESFTQTLSQLFFRQPQWVSGSSKLIQSVVWCSGGAQDYIVEAAQLGADAYISGEISERTFYQAQELGMHYFACGHHATERYGVQALGEYLQQRFNLGHVFIETNNPV